MCMCVYTCRHRVCDFEKSIASVTDEIARAVLRFIFPRLFAISCAGYAQKSWNHLADVR